MGTSSMSTMKLTVCVCFLFIIEVAPLFRTYIPYGNRAALPPTPWCLYPPCYRSALPPALPPRCRYPPCYRSGGETGEEFDLQVLAQMFPGAGSGLGQLIQGSIASGRFQDGINQILGKK